MFRRKPRRRPRMDTWLYVASLAATAWFVWVSSVSPRPMLLAASFTPASMAGVASAGIHGGVLTFGAMRPLFSTMLAAICFHGERAILTLLLAAGITVVRYGSGLVSDSGKESSGATKADDGF